MIGYLEGTVLHNDTEGILLLAGSIGYEILLTPITVLKVGALSPSDTQVSFYIYYHQTERQPKPVLIGFESLEEKAFFQTFITVSAIGPMKALKAMTRPVHELASAIEQKDVTFLTGLPGIGKRTAQKIIATLHGKVEKFAGETVMARQQDHPVLPERMVEISRQVADVLVEQLGHSSTSAARMVNEAMERNPDISTAEELFDEIYQEKP